jgi:hypothetical protein
MQVQNAIVHNAADEDWELLTTFFPTQWRDLAKSSGALKGLRQDKGEESYLRVLMLHFGCGLSMRETVTRANEAELAKLSSVALFKRLRKSREWLYQLCRALFEERGIKPTIATKHDLRLVDGTLIKEPGPTGAQWRIHYSLRWPALRCDYFKLSPVEGEGSGSVRFARVRSPSHWPTSNSDAKPASRVRSCSPKRSYTPNM